MLRERATNLLSTRQLGIGVTDGATADAHCARRFLSACREGEGILKLDFKNGFNSVERGEELTAVYDHFPELAPYIYSSYGTATYLFHGSRYILSSQGVQQGDPLGPLLFATATFNATSTPECRFAVWYLDDGTLGGSSQEVLAGLDRVAEACSSIGLELNAMKCETVSSSAEFSAAITNRLPGCRVTLPDSAELLGAPLGKEAANASLANKVAALRSSRARLSPVDRHDALALFRVSLGNPRTTYILRAGPAFDSPQLKEYD